MKPEDSMTMKGQTKGPSSDPVEGEQPVTASRPGNASSRHGGKHGVVEEDLLVPKLQLGNGFVPEALLPQPRVRSRRRIHEPDEPHFITGTIVQSSPLPLLRHFGAIPHLLPPSGEAGASWALAFPSWSLGTRERGNEGKPTISILK